MKRYYITDIFGNESEVSKLTFYLHSSVGYISVIGMGLALVGVIIDCIKSL